MPPLPESPRELLVRGVNWLGDAVMTTPALLRLRERFPTTRITLLTPAKLADLWSAHPALDAVLTFPPGESPMHLGRRLREGRFDTVLILPNSLRSALECWLARIPHRLGYPANARSPFLTHRVHRPATFVRMQKRSVGDVRRRLQSPAPPPPTPDPPPSAHHLHHYLHLAAALGANPEPLPPLLTVTPGDLAAARQKFGISPDSTWSALNAGAEYGPAKRWPADRFLAAASETQRRSGHRWILLGGPADRPLADELAASLTTAFPHAPPLNLAGRTSLRELAAVLAACRLLLTNDTGPMHVAAAVGTRVVALFGSTSPALTGPGLPADPRHTLLRTAPPCAPCFLRQCPVDFRCMRSIEVDAVVRALLALP